MLAHMAVPLRHQDVEHRPRERIAVTRCDPVIQATAPAWLDQKPYIYYGTKEAIGLRISQDEGAKFCLRVLTEIKSRGVQETRIACVDGLKGFPEAIATAFPKVTAQLCAVRTVRNSLDLVSWRSRKEVVLDLRTIYTGTIIEAEGRALANLGATWDARYSTFAQAWRRNWDQLIPFYDFPKRSGKSSTSPISSNRST